MDDLQKQLAEMPCPRCYEVQDVLIEALSDYCEDCDNTVLRYPTLSRKISMGDPQHSARNLIGSLVPDVTLEKILRILNRLGYDVLGFQDGGDVFYIDNGEGYRSHLAVPYISGEGDSYLEAACAALLAC